MTHPSATIRVLAEASVSPDAPWSLVHAVAKAVACAGVDALRVPALSRNGDEALDAWIDLRKAVLRLNMDLLVTVSAVEDVATFVRAGVGGLAVPTALAGVDPQMLDAVGHARLPVFVLSDRLPDPDLAPTVEGLQRYDSEVTLLFGSADRPTPAERLGLDRITVGSATRSPALGFADRSGTGWPALAACTLGADVVELPVALSPHLPAWEGALTAEALEGTVKGVRYLAWARAHEASR